MVPTRTTGHRWAHRTAVAAGCDNAAVREATGHGTTVLDAVLLPAALLATLTLAGVLVLSGVAKARDRHRAAAGFRALGLPEWTVRLPGPELLAWTEVALALALVGGSGPLLLAAAGAAVLLCAAYLVVIVRAVRAPEPVRCACFGRVLDQPVSGWTVARNALLLGCAGLTLYAASAGWSLPAGLGRADPGDWGAFGGAVLAVAVVGCLLAPGATARAEGPSDTVPGRPTGSPGPASAHTGDGSAGPAGPQPIPAGVLLDEHGGRLTPAVWSAQGARLLLFLSPGCAPCRRVRDSVPAWRDLLGPGIDVQVVLEVAPSATAAEPGTLGDPGGELAAALSCVRTPSAVLLGRDGLLAGGPVAGEAAVADLVAVVRDRLPG